MPFERIIVGVDGSQNSVAAYRWADALAARSGAALTVVMAWHYPYVTTMPGIVAAVPPHAEMEAATLTGLREVIGPTDPGRDVELLAPQGSSATVLLDASRDADLLVVGSRGHGGLMRRVLGSTSRQCATHAECSVAVIRAGTPPLPAEPLVAVAVDGSDQSVAALTWALQHLAGGRVRVIHSHDEWVLDELDVAPDLAEQLQEAAEQRVEVAVATAAAGAGRRVDDVEQLVLHGDPRQTVIDSLDDADVLVVGDRGHGGLVGTVLGSFTTYVLDHPPEGPPLIIARP